MLVEAFVAEPAVEGLDVGVLVRLARFDQSQLYAALVRPSHHGLAAELFVVVGADHLRQAAAQRQAIQHPSHPMPGDGPLGLDGNRSGEASESLAGGVWRLDGRDLGRFYRGNSAGTKHGRRVLR